MAWLLQIVAVVGIFAGIAYLLWKASREVTSDKALRLVVRLVAAAFATLALLTVYVVFRPAEPLTVELPAEIIEAHDLEDRVTDLEEDLESKVADLNRRVSTLETRVGWQPFGTPPTPTPR